jgi:hypothetical protein
MRFASGARLGAFEILAPLGAGGMGEVYRARDTRLERTVAVKVLPSEIVNATGRSVERFQQEARQNDKWGTPPIARLLRQPFTRLSRSHAGTTSGTDRGTARDDGRRTAFGHTGGHTGADLTEVLDQHQIRRREVSMDEDRLSVRRHRETRGVECFLDGRENSHTARRKIEQLDRNLGSWRPGLEQAAVAIPVSPVAAWTVIHTCGADCEAQTFHARDELTWCSTPDGNSQERRVGKTLIDNHLSIGGFKRKETAASCRDADGRSAIRGHLPDIVAAPHVTTTTVGEKVKVDPLAIAGPRWRTLRSRICGDAAGGPAAAVDDPDIGTPIGRRGFECNPPSVW